MQQETKIISLSFTLGLLLWLTDAALDYFIFYKSSFWDLVILDVPSHELYIRLLILTCFIIFGLICARFMTLQKKAEKKQAELIAELNTALKEVRILTGYLPICSSCKKIRDDQGYWSQVEEYIGKHSQAEFSHSTCPDCVRKLYPEMADQILKE